MMEWTDRAKTAFRINPLLREENACLLYVSSRA